MRFSVRRVDNRSWEKDFHSSLHESSVANVTVHAEMVVDELNRFIVGKLLSLKVTSPDIFTKIVAFLGVEFRNDMKLFVSYMGLSHSVKCIIAPKEDRVLFCKLIEYGNSEIPAYHLVSVFLSRMQTILGDSLDNFPIRMNRR